MRGVSGTIDLEAPGAACGWIGDVAMFASGDGEVFALRNGEAARRRAHDGAVLCACPHPDGASWLTGGDDGRVLATRPGAAPVEIARFKGKLVDHLVASAASGVIAAGVGKTAHVFPRGAAQGAHAFTYPSTIGGLALDAKGRKLVASHYGGATVRYALMAEDAGVALRWAGSHLAATMSPDGDYVLTAMQEMELHGWRLPEKTDLRMSGYAAKTKSFSWDRRGRWLATSGAPCAVVWPFVGKTGPQNKAPVMVAEREALVTQVAFHPREDRIAIGYADGAVHAATLDPAGEARLVAPAGAAIAALAWRADGAALAFADEAGAAGVLML